MLFGSWLFLVFFLTVLALYGMKRFARFRTVELLIASYIFYGWLNPLYVALIIYTTAVNYIAGIRIDRTKGRAWLIAGVLNNVLVLGFFKYAGFVAENINHVLHLVDPSLGIPMPGRLLPIGLSFYTFLTTGYLIDVYRGTVEPERNVTKFASFVAFFPYLLAGPIERASNMLPQLSPDTRMKASWFTEGLSLFVVGLFKKKALADFLSLYVAKVYGAPEEFNSLALLAATYAFAWQIYFDFSGYTDMARGVARMLGFKLMLNFNNPYLATGLGDFWGRWHISLSSWFKDYLYIPLGGNRRGRINTYRNMIITMLVAGLWHGAAWTFVIWGGLHALGRSVTRELERTVLWRDSVPKLVKQLLTFAFVCLTWIFFRAETFGKAVTVLKGIFAFDFGDPEIPIVALVMTLAVWLYQFAYESRLKVVLAKPVVKVSLMAGMIMYLILFGISGYEPFIYFQF